MSKIVQLWRDGQRWDFHANRDGMLTLRNPGTGREYCFHENVLWGAATKARSVVITEKRRDMRGHADERQEQVLRAIHLGLSQREVARQFGISKTTVRRYLGLVKVA